MPKRLSHYIDKRWSALATVPILLIGQHQLADLGSGEQGTDWLGRAARPVQIHPHQSAYG